MNCQDEEGYFSFYPLLSYYGEWRGFWGVEKLSIHLLLNIQFVTYSIISQLFLPSMKIDSLIK